MANEPLDTMVKTLIETQVIQALNSAPDAIEKMVKVALTKPVDKNGNPEGSRDFSYHSDKIPYLEWMVGQEIRFAATSAARKVIAEFAPKIEDEVRKELSSESVVAAVTKSFTDAAAQDWRIEVKFAADDKQS